MFDYESRNSLFCKKNASTPSFKEIFIFLLLITGFAIFFVQLISKFSVMIMTVQEGTKSYGGREY